MNKVLRHVELINCKYYQWHGVIGMCLAKLYRVQSIHNTLYIVEVQYYGS